MFPALPWLGPVVGLVVAIAVTWLARRLAMGTVLLVASAVAAAVPLFTTATQQSENPMQAFTFTEGAARPNVVWIVADELSYPLVFDQDGRVRDNLPNIQALQGDSTTYTRTYAAANFTDYAIPAMLTGISDVAGIDKARMDKVRANIGIVPGFAEDYSVVMESPMYGFECDTVECASVGADTDAGVADRLWMFAKDVVAITARTVLAEPFVSAFPSIDGKWRDFWASGDEFGEDVEGDTVGAVIDGIAAAQQASPGTPFLAFWHTIRTHGPWVLDADAKRIFPSRVPIIDKAHMVGSRANETVATDELASMSRRLYVYSAQDVDRQVGQLVARLKESGAYDDTLIIFTADHGVAVTQRNIRRYGDSEAQRWSEIAHVPLIVKSRGQTEPEVVTDVRSTGQIARTVLDATGVQVPADLQLSPPLTEALPMPPVFSTVTTAKVTGHPFPAIDEVDPWTDADLFPDPVNPFAIGIDPALLGQPVGAGAVEQPAQLTTFDGESDLQLVVAQRDTAVCGPATVGLVTPIAGDTVIGSVLWEGEAGSRGWAIVPRSAEGYRLWCAPAPSAGQDSALGS